MSAKPRIFVSAVSKELRRARQRVVNALISIGYEPEFLDVFPAEHGDLKEMLRRKIDSCEGLIQVVGLRFGCGPIEPDDDKDAVSYTQFELHYARERRLKTWPIILAEKYPVDEPNDEPEAHRQNQQRYRRSFASASANHGLENLLYHEAGTPAELENVVLRLRNELDILHAQWRKHQRRTFAIIATTAVGILLLLALVSLVSRDAGQTRATTTRVERKLDQTQLALDEVVRRLPFESRESEHGNEAATRSKMFSASEKKYGLPPGTIARELPVFGRRLAADGAVTPFRRAQGAYAARDYLQAERLALEAVTAAKKAVPSDRLQLLHALELAGRSASARRDFGKAIDHYLEAASLVEKTRDPAEYMRVHQALDSARAAAGAALLARPVPAQKPASNANALDILADGIPASVGLGPPVKVAVSETQLQAEAAPASHLGTEEAVQRGVTARTPAGSFTETAVPNDKPALAERERQAGPKKETGVSPLEKRETVAARSSAAAELLAEGKAEQAETEYRMVLKLCEESLGPENSVTLSNRTQLASALSAQRKFALAEAEHRAVFRIRDRVLGPTNAATLASRSSVASALVDQGRHAEADREYRAVLGIRTKVLGPTAPDTLASRSMLGETLFARRLFPEAEAEYQAVLKIREKELRPEDPGILKSRSSLAAALMFQEKFALAEMQIRLVLEIQERNLGPDDTNTLSSRVFFGDALFAQTHYLDAEKEYRTVIRILERLPRSSDLEVAAVRKPLALALNYQGKFKDAEGEYLAIVAARQQALGGQDTNTLSSIHELAVFLESQRKIEDAREWAGRAVEGARTAWGLTNPVTKAYEQHEQNLRRK